MNIVAKIAWIVLVGFTVTCSACKHEKGYVKTEGKPKPAPVITAKRERRLDSISFSKDNDDDFVIDPMTLGPIGLYEHPDTSTPVKEILPAFTPFKRLGHRTINSQVQKPGLRPGDPPYTEYASLIWYRIRTDNGKEGYLNYVGENIAKYTFTDKARHIKYLAGTCLENKKTNNWKMGFFKFDMISQKITSKVSCELLGEAQEKIAVMKSLPLTNVRFAIHFNQTAAFCGGGESNETIVDTPNGLVRLPECYNSFADDDYSVDDNDTIYLPVAGNTGHITLYANGLVIKPVNDSITFKPDTISYPANAIVPINDVIVKVTELGKAYVNKAGEPITINGHLKYKSHSKTTTYYHWDGQKATIAYKEFVKLK